MPPKKKTAKKGKKLKKVKVLKKKAKGKASPSKGSPKKKKIVKKKRSTRSEGKAAEFIPEPEEAVSFPTSTEPDDPMLLKIFDRYGVSMEAVQKVYTEAVGDGSELSKTQFKQFLLNSISIEEDSLLEHMYDVFPHDLKGGLAAICTLRSSDILTRLSLCFRVFDKDGDGFITVNEMTSTFFEGHPINMTGAEAEFLFDATESWVAKAFQEMDTDQDTKLCQADCRACLESDPSMIGYFSRNLLMDAGLSEASSDGTGAAEPSKHDHMRLNFPTVTRTAGSSGLSSLSEGKAQESEGGLSPALQAKRAAREAKREEMKRMIAAQKRKAMAARRARREQSVEASMGFELVVDSEQASKLEARRTALEDEEAAKFDDDEFESESEYEYVTDYEEESSSEDEDAVEESIHPGQH